MLCRISRQSVEEYMGGVDIKSPVGLGELGGREVGAE